jgi:hypothetical protein
MLPAPLNLISSIFANCLVKKCKQKMKMKMAELREGTRSYSSVLCPKERGAHPLSKYCVVPGLVLFLAVGSGANPNFDDNSNTVL